MYQKLLATRFKLAFHHNTRELPVYAIVLAKDGPKLTRTDRRPGDSTGFAYTSQIVLTVRNSSMSDFADGMRDAFLDKPVVDQTGLNDRYDFVLKWTPDDAPAVIPMHHPASTRRFRSNSASNSSPPKLLSRSSSSITSRIHPETKPDGRCSCSYSGPRAHKLTFVENLLYFQRMRS